MKSSLSIVVRNRKHLGNKAKAKARDWSFKRKNTKPSRCITVYKA